jgi:hypothetical protein
MKPFFTDRGHLNEEGVALYVDALRLERTERLAEHIREHVAGCQECRMEVTGLYSVLREEPLPHDHTTLGRESRHWSIPASAYRIAAAIVAVAGIGALVYFLAPWSGEPQQAPPVTVAVPQAPDSAGTLETTAPERGEGRAIAADFRPDEELEGLVGSETRGEAFDVSSPGERSPREAVTFAWVTSEQGPWSIVLLNNRGNVLRKAEVRSIPFVLKGPFKPGLYYWKVIRNDELSHVGKFRVE